MPDATSPDRDKPAPSNLWTKLISGVKSAIELRVVTYIGDVEIEGEFGSPTLRFPKPEDSAGRTLATTIDMVEGDITTAIPDAFWTPENQAIRDYHQGQVSQAHHIVERNVRLILELADKLQTQLREVPSEAETPPTPDKPGSDDS